jgi:hypothetical protein
MGRELPGQGVLYPGFWGGSAVLKGLAGRSRGLICGCRSRRCSCPASTTEVANVTADLDTRCGELYASGDEVLRARQGDCAG